MPIQLNTNTSLTGLDFDLGYNSLDGTIIIDLDRTYIAAGSHCGVAFNRHGQRLGSGGLGGAVATANQSRLWYEAAGPIIQQADGMVQLEKWYRRTSGENEAFLVRVGSVGANKLVRITHTTSGTTRVCSINAIPSLGGALGALLVPPFHYDAGTNSDMRSGLFSPFVVEGTLTYRCTRKD